MNAFKQTACQLGLAAVALAAACVITPAFEASAGDPCPPGNEATPACQPTVTIAPVATTAPLSTAAPVATATTTTLPRAVPSASPGGAPDYGGGNSLPRGGATGPQMGVPSLGTR